MSLDLVEHIAEQAAALGVFKVSLGGGEPLLHPRWYDAILSFKKRTIDVSLSTNGINLADVEVSRNLARLCTRTVTVSLDGYDPPSFEAVRGDGSFARVVAGIMEA